MKVCAKFTPLATCRKISSKQNRLVLVTSQKGLPSSCKFLCHACMSVCFTLQRLKKINQLSCIRNTCEYSSGGIEMLCVCA